MVCFDMLFNINAGLEKCAAVELAPESCPSLFGGTAKRAFGLPD